LATRANDGQPPPFKHASKPNVVTIPGHLGHDLPAGTLKAIYKAAGLEEKK
jgi:predicted RNA binding protein YcfA (HicA-like mRNA interferase family)